MKKKTNVDEIVEELEELSEEVEKKKKQRRKNPIKTKVKEILGAETFDEKVNESRGLLKTFKEGIKPKKKTMKEWVSKKEMKQLMKNVKKKKDESGINQFFVSLIKKIEFRKFRKRNKKLLDHKIH